ncbi:hypothetical protein [Novosphingobium sp. PP1Y]|uniref:hypothetical protein n=1 Tax=Novosphingobium sp. PP1Y TaxID=702113 RepID=UPI00020F0447|nr:hypothetical protein [Novosphingobium sp. PP1Y]CCA90975.1 conserved hypothetical protein [Novosphingobium sp. PP1Y]
MKGIFARSTLAAMVLCLAHTGTALAETGGVDRIIGDPAGTGPYPAIAQVRADAPGYTLYRPAQLPAQPLPLVLWGNGGCRDNGLSASHLLREVASHGYVIIANGSARQERDVLDAVPEKNGPTPPPGGRPTVIARSTPDETSVTHLLAAIDWAMAHSALPGDALAGHIDTTRVAVMGHSCGGLQAIAAGGDPRISTVVAFNSGIYDRSNGFEQDVRLEKTDLARLHTSIAYILGGPQDVAFPNGMDDFDRIDRLPVLAASLPIGHGGTFMLENGGIWAQIGTAWLNWQINRDPKAARWFVGPDCTLCTAPGWTVERKNFPEAQ